MIGGRDPDGEGGTGDPGDEEWTPEGERGGGRGRGGRSKARRRGQRGGAVRTTGAYAGDPPRAKVRTGKGKGGREAAQAPRPRPVARPKKVISARERLKKRMKW